MLLDGPPEAGQTSQLDDRATLDGADALGAGLAATVPVPLLDDAPAALPDPPLDDAPPCPAPLPARVPALAPAAPVDEPVAPGPPAADGDAEDGDA
jgi:hypothetical protein